MAPFDFVAAVAVGAIVGRVPNSSTTSYLAGAATLVTILIAHRIVTMLRRVPRLAPMIDHRPAVLVHDAAERVAELRRCGLTRSDLDGLLRQQGVADLDDVRYVVFEQRGRVSSVGSQCGPTAASSTDLRTCAPSSSVSRRDGGDTRARTAA